MGFYCIDGHNGVVAFDKFNIEWVSFQPRRELKLQNKEFHDEESTIDGQDHSGPD